MCSWGVGPNIENFKKRNSTGNASWGVGSQHREFRKEILQAMQVGDDKEIFFLYHTCLTNFQNTKVTSLVYQRIFCIISYNYIKRNG